MKDKNCLEHGGLKFILKKFVQLIILAVTSLNKVPNCTHHITDSTCSSTGFDLMLTLTHWLKLCNSFWLIITSLIMIQPVYTFKPLVRTYKSLPYCRITVCSLYKLRLLFKYFLRLDSTDKDFGIF